jgi:hypothetical protein
MTLDDPWTKAYTLWGALIRFRFASVGCERPAVAPLELTGTHRRATFARLARLPQPFTIAVSGLAADGLVLWQAGLSDLYLHGGSPAGRAGVSGRARTGGQTTTVSPGRRELVSPKRPKKDPPSAKAGKTRKPKAKKKTARGK